MLGIVEARSPPFRLARLVLARRLASAKHATARLSEPSIHSKNSKDQKRPIAISGESAKQMPATRSSVGEKRPPSSLPMRPVMRRQARNGQGAPITITSAVATTGAFLSCKTTIKQAPKSPPRSMVPPTIPMINPARISNQRRRCTEPTSCFCERTIFVPTCQRNAQFIAAGDRAAALRTGVVSLSLYQVSLSVLNTHGLSQGDDQTVSFAVDQAG